VIGQNGDVFFLLEVALCQDDGTPSLRDSALSPKRIALKNSRWIWENKNGAFCCHIPRTVSTFRPEPFFKGPKVVFVCHDP
jgi:hypothetical protein